MEVASGPQVTQTGEIRKEQEQQQPLQCQAAPFLSTSLPFEQSGAVVNQAGAETSGSDYSHSHNYNHNHNYNYLGGSNSRAPIEGSASGAMATAMAGARGHLRQRSMDARRYLQLEQRSVDYLAPGESSLIIDAPGQEASPEAELVQPDDNCCSKGLEEAKVSQLESATKSEKRKFSKQRSNKSTFNQQFAMQSIHSLSMQINTSQSVAAEISSVGLGSPLGNQLSSAATNMASNQLPANLGAGNKLSRLVGKKAARLKEIVLQNLGRADRTHDELFQIYEENFYKQQAQALRLQKEFKVYVNSLKGAHESAKSLNSCIQQSTGEYQSARHDLVCENLNQLEHLSDDLMEKLRDQIVVSINEYLSQFGELREKIAKRRRKLIDYDSSRRVYELMLSNLNKKRMKQQQQLTDAGAQLPDGQVRGLRSAFSLSGSGCNLEQQVSAGGVGACDQLQSVTSQLVDEARLLKMREQFNYCKIMYETINSELHEELPMVYEKKMKHLLMTLQNYFSLEAQFSLNAGKLYATISDVVDELPMSIVNHHGLHHYHRHSHSHSHNYHHHHDHEATEVDQSGPASVGAEPGANGANEEPSNYHKVPVSGTSSSGVGSSRGDSSMESSSSPDNSIGDLTGQPAGATLSQAQEQEQVDESGNELGSGSVQQNRTEELGETTKRGEEQDAVSQQIAMDSAEKAGAQDGAAQEPVVSAGEATGVVGDNEQQVSSSFPAKPEEVEEAVPKEASCESEKTNDIPVASRAHGNQEGAKKGLVVVESDLQSSECLYKVKTNYKYLAEDVDELCFEADEVIRVVAFDATHEPEEGWLMGIREVNGQRGLFPANFTRPL